MMMRILLTLLALCSTAFAQNAWTDALFPTVAQNALNVSQLGTDNAGGLYYVLFTSGSVTTNNLGFKIMYRPAGTTTDTDVTGNYPSTGCNVPRAIAAAPDGAVWVVNEIFVCNGTATNINETPYKNASAGSAVWTNISGGPGQSSNPNITVQHIFTAGIQNHPNGYTCFAATTAFYCDTAGNLMAFANLGIWATPFQTPCTAATVSVAGQNTYTCSGLVFTPAKSTFTVAGFTNSGNNGDFTIVSSTSTTVTVTNSGGVAETHAATGAMNFTSTAGPPRGTTAIAYSLAIYDAGDGNGVSFYISGESDVMQTNIGGVYPSFPAQVVNAFLREDWSGGASTYRNNSYDVTRIASGAVVIRPCDTGNAGCANQQALTLVADGVSRTQALTNSSAFQTLGPAPTHTSWPMGGTGATTQFISFITNGSTPGIRFLESTTNNGATFTNLVPSFLTLFSGCSNTTASLTASVAGDGTHIWIACKDGSSVWHLGQFGPPAPPASGGSQFGGNVTLGGNGRIQ